MEPRLVELDQATAMGIDVRTSNPHEMDPATAQIPGLWQRFSAEGVLEKVPAKTQPAMPVGVYTDYESDHLGPYRLLIGARVEAGTQALQGFSQANIPAGRFLVFSAQGEIPKIVIALWMDIWTFFEQSKKYRRAYTTDFELFTGMDSVEIHIAVR